MSRDWAAGSTRAWRRVRAWVLRRDRIAGFGCRAHEDQTLNLCEAAGVARHVCTHRPEAAHHYKGRKITGDDPRYIVSSCHPCNLAIGDPSARTDPHGRGYTRW